MSEQRENDDGPSILTCASWSTETFMQMSGNATGKCFYCGASVVISVEGQQILAEEPEMQVGCLSCSLKELADEGGEIEVPPAIRAKAEAVTGKELPADFLDTAKESIEILKREEERRSNS
jgi:ribosomal protein S27E